MTEPAKLADASANGVFQLMCEPYEIEREAKSLGLLVKRADIGHAHDKKDFLGHVSRALEFPDWFGGNWDALHDCLTDLAWLPANGYALVLEKAKHFGAGHKQEFAESIEVLRSAAEHWKKEGKPFFAFVHGAQGWDAGLPPWP